MWVLLKGISQLIIFFLSFTIFTNAHVIDHDTSTDLKVTEKFTLKNIDKTSKEDIKKIKQTRRYPLNYSEAIHLLEFNLLNNLSPSSLFHYTYLSEESKSDDDLSREQILKIMLKYLKNSTIQLNQKELDGQAWPKLNSKTHLLFVLSYDMDGFLALIKFIIDREIGTVSLEEIAD